MRTSGKFEIRILFEIVAEFPAFQVFKHSLALGSGFAGPREGIVERGRLTLKGDRPRQSTGRQREFLQISFASLDRFLPDDVAHFFADLITTSRIAAGRARGRLFFGLKLIGQKDHNGDQDRKEENKFENRSIKHSI